MTEADSIWKSKLSRLQDPKVEKMKPLLVELMGELRERRRERGELRSHAQALRRAHRGRGGVGCSGDDALASASLGSRRRVHMERRLE